MAGIAGNAGGARIRFIARWLMLVALTISLISRRATSRVLLNGASANHDDAHTCSIMNWMLAPLRWGQAYWRC